MTGEPERPPLFIERFHIAHGASQFYSNFHVTGKYNKPLDTVLLSNVLHLLINRNPVFSLTINSEGKDLASDIKHDYKNYKVSPVQKITFNDVAEVTSRPYSERELAYVNDSLIENNTGTVTWRAILYADNYLTFYNNHTFFDGEAGANFHKEVLDILNELEHKKLEFQDTLFDLSPGFQLPLPLDELTDIHKLGLLTKARLVVKELCPELLKNIVCKAVDRTYPNFIRFPFFKLKYEKTYKTNIRLIKIDNTTIKGLLDYLRCEGTTLTSFLTIAVNYCFQKTMVEEPRSVVSAIDISGRRYHTELKNQLKFSNFVTLFVWKSKPLFELQELIPQLKRLNKSLRSEVTSQIGFKWLGLLKLTRIRDVVEPKKKTINQSYTVEISNLGYHEFSLGNWAVSDVTCSQCLGVSATFSLTLVSCNTGMNIGYAFLDEFKDYPHEQFIQLLQSTIYEFSQQNNQKEKQSL